MIGRAALKIISKLTKRDITTLGLHRAFLLAAIGVTAAIISFYGTMIIASEMGEVVTLTTYDAANTPHETRLWVVDHENAEWLRTGHADKGWFLRIRENPTVKITRKGVASTRRAVPVTAQAVTNAIAAKFSEKYGAADWIVALSGDADLRIPLRLDPVEPKPST